MVDAARLVPPTEVSPPSAVLASVLLGLAVVAWLALRSRERRASPVPAAPTAVAVAAPPDVLDLLLELGEALVDAGDATLRTEATLRRVAAVHGVPVLGVVVLPTAVLVSVPGPASVDTEVTAAGTGRLRLDQVDAVLGVVDGLLSGEVTPARGVAELARIRGGAPPFGPVARLLGHVVLTLGLTLILGGQWRELVLAAALGVLVGALHEGSDRMRQGYQAFLPVAAAVSVSAAVFAVAAQVPRLEVLPPLIAPLAVLLPGALLTTAVLDLATGAVVSGAARLAAGGLRLALLALGLFAGTQLVGVPVSGLEGPQGLDGQGGGVVGAAASWLGVSVFAVGVVLFVGTRFSALPWLLVVLHVAYAGQVLGGLFFGAGLSAFFGAWAMTPVATAVARRPSAPAALVSFLPGFWLLVPGAVGLVGLTRILDDDRVAGVAALVTTGTSMVLITLGVLLGLATGAWLAGQDVVAPGRSRRPSGSALPDQGPPR